MTVTFQPITRDNWRAVDALTDSLSAEHQRFIAPNAFSMLEALYEPERFTACAIYADNTPVGLLMTAFKDGRHWIMRLMIGADYQRKGYGQQAMALILEKFKADSDCDEVYISFITDNHVARDLYTRLGFEDTGVIDEDEAVYRLPLRERNSS